MGNGRDRIEVAREMLQIHEEGGNMLDYLVGLGYKNPQQAYHDIKAYIRGTDPEMYKRFPVNAKAMTKQEKEQKPEPEQTDEPEEDFTKADATEEQKPKEAMTVDGMPVTGVMGAFGEWHFDRKHRYIDFTGTDGEEISMPEAAWEEFVKEYQKIRRRMGVDE